MVFLQGLPHRGWVMGFRNNDPDFTNDVILCKATPGRMKEVMDAFPRREYYRLVFPEEPEHPRLERIVSP